LINIVAYMVLVEKKTFAILLVVINSSEHIYICLSKVAQQS